MGAHQDVDRVELQHPYGRQHLAEVPDVDPASRALPGETLRAKRKASRLVCVKVLMSSPSVPLLRYLACFAPFALRFARLS